MSPEAVRPGERPRLVLASSSPRRRALLEQLGLTFSVRPAAVDEPALQAGWESSVRGGRAVGVDDLVRRLAGAKARAVPCLPGEIVIAADTVVAVAGDVLGKPRTADDALDMLRRLTGRSHEVWTGVAVRTVARETVAAELTRVWMRDAQESALRAYVRSGEPFDKAGAYAIQGLGAALVTRIEGCYYNVVGLPLPHLVDMLAAFDLQVLG